MKTKLFSVFYLVCLFFLFQKTSLVAQQAYNNEDFFWISNPNKSWIFGIDPKIGLTYFGLDSEGNGKSETNLLSEPINITWNGFNEKKAGWKKINT